MKILFLNANGEGWTARDTSKSDFDADIKYWLGKSPGIHELAHIFVVDESDDKVMIQQQLREEELQYELARKAAQERELYEHLKQKYERET